MRLWSIHPQYLDAKDLVALWWEGLQAQTILLGETGGYSHYPRLARFRESGNAVGAIADYLRVIADEADQRGCQFDRGKIVRKRFNRRIRVTTGQVGYEFDYLMSRLMRKAPAMYTRYAAFDNIRLHPLFVTRGGDVEDWGIIETGTRRQHKVLS